MIFNAYSDSKNKFFNISIKSAGHIFAKNGRCINRPSGRGDWLLFYVAKGCETFFTDSEVKGDAGSFIIFRPFEKQHHAYLESRTGEFYFVHFDADDDFDMMGLSSSAVYHTKPTAKTNDLFEEIIGELLVKQENYEKLCTALFYEIMCRLSRAAASKDNPHTKYMDKISYVLQIMNREYNENHSLDEFAKMCSMSKYHFVRVFGEITGMSPVEYKNSIRMEHAKEMLEDGNLTISEISSKLGFSSPAYFCDAFKKKNGISPSGYRCSLANNKKG